MVLDAVEVKTRYVSVVSSGLGLFTGPPARQVLYDPHDVHFEPRGCMGTSEAL